IAVPSLAGATFDGRVRLVGVSADPATATYPVEIAVQNPAHRLKAGMIAEASIKSTTKLNRLTIPGAAISRDAEGATRVFVYDPKDQRVHARRVDVIGVHGKDVEIAEGLSDGEQVAVGGMLQLHEGMRAQPAASPATTGGNPAAGPTNEN